MDSFHKYIHDYLYISNQLLDVSDFVKVHIFTSNLQSEVGSEVRYKKPITLTHVENLNVIRKRLTIIHQTNKFKI